MKIREFDGSLRDAQGIIDVDRATFADCPYTAAQIVALEAEPGQHAWVAQEGARIVGYVSAFATSSQAAERWEVDELAVHPQAQGRGIGTALVARALEAGAQQAGLRKARALVSVDNPASQQVFLKNGFRVVETVHLLAYRVNGRFPRPPRPNAPKVRPAQAGEDLVLARLFGGDDVDEGDVRRMARQLQRADVYYLVVADASGELGGGAELIHVRTLQYEGFWIETLAVTGSEVEQRRALLALFGAAIEAVKRQEGMDLVGYLAVPRDRGIYSAAIGEGMALVDAYKLFVYEW